MATAARRSTLAAMARSTGRNERREPCRSNGPPLSAAGGLVVGLTGLGLVGTGLWARREVRRALARERIVSTPDARPASAPVTSGAAARSMAEVIRAHTLEATGGRTYAETDAYVAADGGTTPDADRALNDERTGAPVENPDHALWLQSTTLQTALMQAYVSERLAELTAALGGALVVAGAGIAAARPRRR